MSRRTELSALDRDAFERAIEITRNSKEPGRREQVDRMLKEEGWFRTADFCVYSCQMDLVRPRLWQPTPADIDPADIETIIARGDDGVGSGRYAAAKLLRRMLRAGLSRYEPDPLRALEAKRRAPAQQPAA